MSFTSALKGLWSRPQAACLTAAAAALYGTWRHRAQADDGASGQSTDPVDLLVGLSSSSRPGSTAAAATAAAAKAPSDASLPTDKLSCKLAAAAPRSPLVLVACGSFNPPTIMHLRMVDLAAGELMRRGYDVWGAYLSPVADSYGKEGLAPAADRVAMCRLAAAEVSSVGSGQRSVEAEPAPLPAAPASKSVVRLPSNPEPDFTMVYDWEARQPGYTRTLTVLRRVEAELRAWLVSGAPGQSAVTARERTGVSEAGAGTNPGGATHAMPTPVPQALQAPSKLQNSRAGKQSPPPQPQSDSQGPAPFRVQAMLLCGGDVLASIAVPGVWRDPDVILREHGVVCVVREGTDLERLMGQPGNVLYDHRDKIVLVYDRVGNSVSSSKVRAELEAGRPVRYLVPGSVLSYIYEKGLYGAGGNRLGDGVSGDEAW